MNGVELYALCVWALLLRSEKSGIAIDLLGIMCDAGEFVSVRIVKKQAEENRMDDILV